jgi:uncharacterized membrane protein
MAEIACRALFPAVNDPGTAIDVIGRGVRILSTYAQNKSDEIEVKYPSVHVAPLQNNDLLKTFSHLSRAMVLYEGDSDKSP